MRVLGAITGLAFLLGGCGGGSGGNAADSTAVRADSGQVSGGGSGAVHDVNMILEGTANYKFDPADITVKPGDRIVFHNVSGFPHNVSFWPDSIPAGAQQVLEPQLPNPIGPLQSELLTEAGRTVTISFAGAPAGEYKFYCTPHLAMGMKGKITVSP